MNVEEKYEYWKTYADRDLDAAGAMLNTGRWFYVVFMCQQALEKLIKGLYCLYVDEENAPRTHNIGLLINRFEDSLPEPVGEECYQLFETLSKHYLADRYPDFISESDEQISEDYATKVFDETREVFTWLLTLRTQRE